MSPLSTATPEILSLIAFVIIILASFWSGRRAFYITLFSLATLASPFILNVLLGSYLPPRTMTQLSVVFAGLITLAIMALRSKTLGIAVCAILLACGSAASNQLFYSGYMARASDEHAAKMMLNTIYQKYPQFDIDKNPVFSMVLMSLKTPGNCPGLIPLAHHSSVGMAAIIIVSITTLRSAALPISCALLLSRLIGLSLTAQTWRHGLTATP